MRGSGVHSGESQLPRMSSLRAECRGNAEGYQEDRAVHRSGEMSSENQPLDLAVWTSCDLDRNSLGTQGIAGGSGESARLGGWQVE